MDKEELIRFDGTVLEALPDGRFSGELDNGHKILAYTSGRIIMLPPGGEVDAELLRIKQAAFEPAKIGHRRARNFCQLSA